MQKMIFLGVNYGIPTQVSPLILSNSLDKVQEIIFENKNGNHPSL